MIILITAECNKRVFSSKILGYRSWACSTFECNNYVMISFVFRHLNAVLGSKYTHKNHKCANCSLMQHRIDSLCLHNDHKLGILHWYDNKVWNGDKASSTRFINPLQPLQCKFMSECWAKCHIYLLSIHYFFHGQGFRGNADVASQHVHMQLIRDRVLTNSFYLSYALQRNIICGKKYTQSNINLRLTHYFYIR